MSSVLALNNVSKNFIQGGEDIVVLDKLNLEIKQGEMVALTGPSGSGKTTLLQIAGLLDNADDGEVVIAGESYSKISDSKRTQARKENIGFVYQYHHLLPEFSALENVMMPLKINAVKEAKERAEYLLEQVGLSDRVTHRPSQLSGGQQQRVAIARGLAHSPALILADEPTGNLDHQTADAVFEFMQKLIKENNCAALIATHNQELVGKMDRVLKLQDGVIL